MHIQQIDPTRRREIQRFIQFAYTLYAHTPQWVPPLRSSRFSAFDRKRHPLYQNAEAEFFMVESGKDVLGTIAVINNQRYNHHTGKQSAFFSYFDCVNDQQVSQMLFDTAFTWARERGLKRIIGPRGLINSDAGGVLVEGFEHPAVMEVPYNFDYYGTLVSAAGFQKTTDHLSGTLTDVDFTFPEKVQRAADLVMRRRGFALQSFQSVDEILPWVPGVLKAYAASFVDNHEYYPPTEQEKEELVSNMLSVADPRLIQLATRGEEVIGFIIAYPDLSEGFRRAKGSLYPFGWVHLLRAKKNSQVAMINGLGIIPEYRGMGSNALMYNALWGALQGSQYKRIEAVMVNETNFTSKSDNETMGVRWYKRHRNYERYLD